MAFDLVLKRKKKNYHRGTRKKDVQGLWRQTSGKIVEHDELKRNKLRFSEGGFHQNRKPEFYDTF